MKIAKQSASLFFITKDAYELMELIGRVSHKSEKNIGKESSEKFVEKLLSLGHDGILEHAYASIVCITDRGISHELVRHRLASYLQESTRYVSSEEMCVIEPPELKGQGRIDWEVCMRECERTYGFLLEKGYPKDVARSVLPTCLKTRIVITANFREWRHIFSLRLSHQAHPQMRELMKMCHSILHLNYPLIFSGKMLNTQ